MFAIRSRGSLILDSDTHYRDVNSKKPLELFWGKSVYIKITTPVGLYVNENKQYLFVTFNPGHIKESVYIKDKDLREYYTKNKYIHQDVLRTDLWDLGIDNLEVIYIIAQLITQKMPFEARRSSIEVAKFCSDFMTNTERSQGLIDFTYENSKNYRSTKDVLLGYIKNNKPIQSNQSCIFACIFQSFMRSLRIPCRCIINNDPLHHIPKDLIVEIKDTKTDVHVWNEIWMQRNDLKTSAYSDIGWQVVDTSRKADGALNHIPYPLKAIYDLSSSFGNNLASLYVEINSVRFTTLYRNGNYYVYDITCRKNDPLIIGEYHDGRPLLKNGHLLYPLSCVKSFYINDKINPISKLFDTEDYISCIIFNRNLRFFEDIFKFEIIMKKLGKYKIFALTSLEHELRSYEPEEINEQTVQIHFPLPGTKYKFNLPNLYSPFENKIPTLRIIVQKDESPFRVNIHLYQYIGEANKAKWVNK